MKDINIKADFSKLEKLIKLLKTKKYVDVGILGETTSEQTEEGKTKNISIAFLGAVHEFGSEKRNIPERSFIIMPIETKQKKIAKEMEKKFPILLGSEKANEVKIIQFLTDVGLKCEEAIQDAFDSGGFGTWPDIQQATKDRKDSDAILIDQGNLRKAITSKVGGK